MSIHMYFCVYGKEPNSNKAWLPLEITAATISLPFLQIVALWHCEKEIQLEHSDFQPFSSHGTHNLISKILQQTKKCIFAYLTKNRCNFDSFTPEWLLLCWLLSFCLVDSLKETKSVPLYNSQVLRIKTSCSTPVCHDRPVENRWSSRLKIKVTKTYGLSR